MIGSADGDPLETASKTRNLATDASGDDGAPRLIVICECGRLTAPALRIVLGNLQEVTVGRGARRHVVRHGSTASLSVPDHEISRTHLVVRSQGRSHRVRVGLPATRRSLDIREQERHHA